MFTSYSSHQSLSIHTLSISERMHVRKRDLDNLLVVVLGMNLDATVINSACSAM